MGGKLDRKPDAFFLVMGTSGSGKTEIGRRLAAALGSDFIEADLFHDADNVAKMREGIGLTMPTASLGFMLSAVPPWRVLPVRWSSHALP